MVPTEPRRMWDFLVTVFLLRSRRWLPEQRRVRWDVQEAVRRPEPHQLPVRAGLWQLCRPGEGQPDSPQHSFRVLQQCSELPFSTGERPLQHFRVPHCRH